MNVFRRIFSENRLGTGLLMCGVMFFSLCFLAIKESYVSTTGLIQLNGTIASASTYLIPQGKGIGSQQLDLDFYLNERKQRFQISENVGDESINIEQKQILQRLKLAKSVSVWIKKTELDKEVSRAFQIAINNGEILLDMNTIKNRNRTDAGILLALGLLFIGLFYLKIRYWPAEAI